MIAAKICLNFLQRTKFRLLPQNWASSWEVLSILKRLPPEFVVAYGLLLSR
jgi:hypothetical protein